MLVAQNSRPHT